MRTRPIQIQIMALIALPLASLIAVWTVVAALTDSGGIRLMRANSLVNAITGPNQQLIAEIQRERLLTVVRAGLPEQRTRTDQAVDGWQAIVDEASLPAHLAPAAGDLRRMLAGLAALRTASDSGRLDEVGVIDAYSRILSAGFRVCDALIMNDDTALYRQMRAVTSLDQAKEALARERALIAGGLGEPARRMFAEAGAVRRFQQVSALAQLDPALAAPYAPTAAFRAFVAVEAAIEAGSTPPETRAVVEAYWNEVELAQAETARLLTGLVAPSAVGGMMRVGLVGVLGFAATLTTLLIWYRFARGLGAELTMLRTTALNLAHVRLPRAVERLHEGQEVVPDPLPPMPDATPEIRDVGLALSRVHQTAVDTVADETRLRRDVGLVFRKLARRSQSLLHRQLAELTTIEHERHEPATVKDLFRLERLTTSMRRHAENLIILSDAAPAPGPAAPVPLRRVVRRALTEVEDFTRIDVAPLPDAALTGPAVADVTHLVAELLDNATIYSPPYTKVLVRARQRDSELTVEVEDRGLGMSAAEICAMNARLADPDAFELTAGDKLGLFVVGRLARRNGLTVTLAANSNGGTTATVTIPYDR